jgi:TonB family protein
MSCKSIKSVLPAVIGAAMLLMTVPVWADLQSAEVAYGKGQFDRAFQQFKELAELGQPQAQYNLAVMYLRGEGVTKSLTLAHAWASLSGANGFAQGSALATKLEPELTPNSLKLSAEIQTQFSQATLDARLLPRMLKGREYESRDPVRSSKPFVPQYPPEAQRKGVQGEVYVEFTVAADGHPRLPRILYAVPAGYFENTVSDSVLRSVYLPARIDGEPTSASASVLYNFTMKGTNIHDYGDLDSRVRETKLKAEAGDPSAQMLYGMMIAGLPQLHQTYDQALPWFLKAAQAGARYAQYQVGTGLLSGRGCQCDLSKGEIWLEKAAQADQADAQVSLAEYLLKEKTSPESLAGAMVWLERAAKQGNESGKLLLAAILAASPSATIRDPARALALIDTLERDYKIDPIFWEIRAAANASRGDFNKAAKAESEAIDRATHLGWDLAPLQKRQALYASRQPWSGNLFDF